MYENLRNPRKKLYNSYSPKKNENKNKKTEYSSEKNSKFPEKYK